MNSVAELNRSVSTMSAAHDFLLVAKTMAASRGRWAETQALAKHLPSIRAQEVLEKTGVTALNTTDATGGAALAAYRTLSAGFFGSMAEFSSFSRIYNAGDFYRVPLRTQICTLTTAPVGASVSELAAKPITSGNFAVAVLDAEKVSSIIALTEESSRSSAQAAMLQLDQELRRAASVQVDAKFLALLAATPGITTAGTTGVTAAAILSDLTARINALTIGADSRLWWIVGPKLFKTLGLVQGTGGYIMQNNKIGSINVAPSDAATTTATLIDAKQIAVELDGVSIDSTREATLQLDTNPTSSAYEQVSLWQNNLTGLKCEIAFGAVAMRSTSVTTITGYAA